MTERKPPAQAKVDGERMFHLLMENVKHFAIFVLDPEGRVVSWNTGAERILGYKEDEILGQPFGVISSHHANRRSTRVMEKLGMTFEKSFIHKGVEAVQYDKANPSTPEKRGDGLWPPTAFEGTKGAR